MSDENKKKKDFVMPKSLFDDSLGKKLQVKYIYDDEPEMARSATVPRKQWTGPRRGMGRSGGIRLSIGLIPRRGR